MEVILLFVMLAGIASAATKHQSPARQVARVELAERSPYRGAAVEVRGCDAD